MTLTTVLIIALTANLLTKTLESKEFKYQPRGGMNLDDDVLAPSFEGEGMSMFELGDWGYALNIRQGNSEKHNLGGIENIVGGKNNKDTKKWNGSSWINSPKPTGTKVVIGAVEDRLNQRLYYCMYHDGDTDHTIYYHDLKTNENRELLRDALLNFNQYKLVTGMAVLQGKYLIITDHDNPPRLIDTNHIIDQDNDFLVSEFHISLVKYPPIAPLSVGMPTGAITDNDLFGGIWQFTYRYKYRNKMKSTWSAWTLPQIDYGLESQFKIELKSAGHIFGLTAAQVTANGGVNGILHSDQRVYDEIVQIEIAAKSYGADTWKIIKRIDTGATLIALLHTVNKRISIIDVAESEIAEPFDNVPLLSEALAFIDNRIMLANNTEEFPEVTGVAIENIAIYVTDGLIAGDNWLEETVSLLPVAISDLNRGNHQSFLIKGRYQLGIVFGDEAVRTSLVYTDDDWRFLAPFDFDDIYVAFGFNFKSTFTPPDWATWYEIVRTECLNIEYFVKSVTNSADYRRKDPADPTKTVTSTFADASELHLDISNWDKATWANAGKTSDNPLNNIFYTYVAGDIVIFDDGLESKIIRIEDGGDTLVVDVNVTDYITAGSINLEIMVYRERAETNTLIFYEMGEWYPIKEPKTGSRDWSKSDWRYTNNTSVTSVTIGQFTYYNFYPIARGDIHAFIYNQFYDFNAATSLVGAAKRLPSMNPWVQTDIWERGNGRPFVSYNIKPEQQLKETQIRFGGKITDETPINNLNNFPALQQKIFPVEYGPIRKLQPVHNAQTKNVGNILLSIHEQESVSIYVGKRTLQDLAGNSDVSVSDVVLGSFNTLKGSYGTKSPESVTAENSRVYFWDGSKKCWCRYSQDGITNISAGGFKMKDFHEQIGNKLASFYDTGVANQAKVISAFDVYNDELVIGFNGGTLGATELIRGVARTYYKTCGFVEKDRRWKSFYYFDSEYMGSIDDILVTFRNNMFNDSFPFLQRKSEGIRGIYNKDSNAPGFNDWFQKFESQIEVIINTYPGSEKVLTAIAIESDDIWEMLDITGSVINNRRKGVLKNTDFKTDLANWINSGTGLNWAWDSGNGGQAIATGTSPTKWLKQLVTIKIGDLVMFYAEVDGGAADTTARFHTTKVALTSERQRRDVSNGFTKVAGHWLADSDEDGVVISVVRSSGGSITAKIKYFEVVIVRQRTQKSLIPLNLFKLKESKWYAEMLKDSDTPGKTGNDALHNGEPMLGQAFTALFQLDPAVGDHSVLRFINFGYTLSHKSNVGVQQ